MPIKPPASIAVSKKGLTLPLSICPITPTSVENHTTIRLVPAALEAFWPIIYIRAGNKITPPPIPIKPTKMPTIKPKRSTGINGNVGSCKDLIWI